MVEKPPENIMNNSPFSPEISTEVIEQILALHDDWDKTEKWIEQGNKLTEDALSVDEMRYAGQQFVGVYCAMQKKSEQKTQTHISTTQHHLLAARHNVVSSIVFYIIERENKIRKNIGTGNLHKYFPEYGDLFLYLADVFEKIPESPPKIEESDRTERNNIYDVIMDKDIPELERLHRKLMANLSGIKDNIKKESSELWITRAIAIGSILIAIALAVM